MLTIDLFRSLSSSPSICISQSLVLKDLGVNCGGHRAESCSVCPQDGTTWHGYVEIEQNQFLHWYSLMQRIKEENLIILILAFLFKVHLVQWRL